MHNPRASTKGFTLIELLVVIAIIGLLSSIVLASLNTARGKSKDAVVQSDLGTVRTQAELHRKGSPGCYPGVAGAGVCALTAQTITTFVSGTCAPGASNNAFCTQPVIQKALSAAQTASGGLISFQTPVGAAAYAVVVQLTTDKALAWCVDSLGTAKREGTVGGTALTQTTLNALIVNNSTCL